MYPTFTDTLISMHIYIFFYGWLVSKLGLCTRDGEFNSHSGRPYYNGRSSMPTVQPTTLTCCPSSKHRHHICEEPVYMNHKFKTHIRGMLISPYLNEIILIIKYIQFNYKVERRINVHYNKITLFLVVWVLRQVWFHDHAPIWYDLNEFCN